MAKSVADLRTEIENAFGAEGLALFDTELLDAAHASSPKNFSGLKNVTETWTRRLTLASAQADDLEVVTALKLNAVANENPDLGDNANTPATAAFTSTEADATDEDKELEAMLADEEKAAASK